MEVCIRSLQGESKIYTTMEAATRAIYAEAELADMTLTEEHFGGITRFIYRRSGSKYNTCFADIEMIEVQE